MIPLRYRSPYAVRAIMFGLFLLAYSKAANAQADSIRANKIPNLTSDTSQFIPWSEYRWADHQMYTLTGDPPRRYTEIQPAAAWTYLGVYFGILAALHYYQEVTFWKASQSFRIREDRLGAAVAPWRAPSRLADPVSRLSSLICRRTRRVRAPLGTLHGAPTLRRAPKELPVEEREELVQPTTTQDFERILGMSVDAADAALRESLRVR